MNKNINKTLGLIAVSSMSLVAMSSAAVMSVDLALPGTNLNIANGTDVTTNVALADGTTFDLVYTLGAVTNAGGGNAGTGAFVISDGANLGVGTAGGNETTPAIIGNANGGGNGISFTGLSIANFSAGSDTTAITGLTFETVTLSGIDNGNDGGFISFNDFVENLNGQAFPVPADGSGSITFDLAALGTPPPTDGTTGLFVEPDSGSAANFFSVTGVSVSFDAVPEPSSTALLGFGGLALLLRRRRQA